ncbi:MAG: 5-methyltetrahydropteroyltriglutamate--homocysteine methyltransferase [Rhodospirillaceae bacterium]|nr:5-methyltetrahydropteroyltriglutamate--homocysteine methyltransferase [Rhodospirillaceae bacterium]|tara:strand:- start:15175 stop:16206 length:1032 start_codon:yes stop_codon:yes gene_type:complete
MTILTTCIGAYPKPYYVPRMAWFHDVAQTGEAAADGLNETERTELFDRATQEVVAEQAEIGIDIPTDGEIRRPNYVHYHCSHVDGFELNTLTECTMRNGAWVDRVPTFTGKIAAREPFLVRDWTVAQAATDKQVKITVPGPLTISDSTANMFYADRASWCADMADALNVEIRRLADAGCHHIQVDEPLFARLPDQALAFGVENLERCFHGVSASVTRTMHMCCGYPDKLDETDYVKADPDVYLRLAKAVDDSIIDAVSIEDAHQHNDLSLLDLFAQSTVVFGAVEIASSRVETVDEIVVRIRAALEHIDRDRLIAAPDCGLIMLGEDLTRAKLANLVAAAKAA